MNVHIMVPYSIEKNLGRAYNQAMEIIPDGDAACFKDGDSMFLSPDFGHIIHEYANRNPDAVLTCWLNRIHELAKGQHLKDAGDDVAGCIKVAERLRDTMNYSTERITGSVSGTLMIIPKHIWKRYPFTETNVYRPRETNILGVDNAFTNTIRANGIQILRMNSVLIYHQYRI